MSVFKAIPAYMSKLIIAGFLIFASFSDAILAQSEFIFYKLTNKDGLSNNTVNDIVQDSSGVLWIATKQGLNKYDSYGFTKYYREDQIDEMGKTAIIGQK